MEKQYAMPPKMSDDEREMLRSMQTCLTELHAHVLGVSGQGGLTRELEAFKNKMTTETAHINKELNKLNAFKMKVLGGSVVISLAIPFVIKLFFGL